MNESITAGLVADAFRLGALFADRRVAALVAVVRSFCGGAAACSRAPRTAGSTM